MKQFRHISAMTAEVIYNIRKVSEVIETELPAQEFEIYRSQVLALAENKLLEAQIAVREYQAEVLTSGCIPLKPRFSSPIHPDSSTQSVTDLPPSKKCPSIVA
jgi:hypothetical protein